jgi:hypothetical protein
MRPSIRTRSSAHRTLPRSFSHAIGFNLMSDDGANRIVGIGRSAGWTRASEPGGQALIGTDFN